MAHDESRASTGRVARRSAISLVVGAMCASIFTVHSSFAADTFIAPEWTSPVCRNIDLSFPGGTAKAGLTPDMVAEVVGVPVPIEGTPAAQTLVVAELGGSVNQSVVRTFLQNCGLDPVTWTDVLEPGASNPPLSGEATLDMTVVAGILPENTTLKTATIENSLNLGDGLLHAANVCGLVGDDPTMWTRSQLDTPVGGCIVTMSYAVFEKSLRSILNSEFGLTTRTEQDTYIADTESVLAGMANSGVITVISSGDEGSGGCQPDTRGQRDEMAPQWPSTSSYALSVGGTMWAPLDWNGAPIGPTNYQPGVELQPVAWRNWELGSDCDWDAAAGETWPGVGTTGGESEFVTRPVFQDGVAGALPGSTGRLSPDVSALAGWPTWLVPLNNDGNIAVYSMGTSAAAPLTAVGLAHVNAALTARGLSPMDNAGGNLDVHNIFYNSAYSSALNDVTEGSNNLWSSEIWTGDNRVVEPVELQSPSAAVPFLDGSGDPVGNTSTTITGYTAKSGYDLTTGMGVPNFSTLAQLLIEAQTVTYDPQGPPPVLQQVPLPSSGSCTYVDDTKYNWGGAGSGGWGESWAQWADAGAGGPICTRTLIYNPAFGIWVIER